MGIFDGPPSLPRCLRIRVCPDLKRSITRGTITSSTITRRRSGLPKRPRIDGDIRWPSISTPMSTHPGLSRSEALDYAWDNYFKYNNEAQERAAKAAAN